MFLQSAVTNGDHLTWPDVAGVGLVVIAVLGIYLIMFGRR